MSDQERDTQLICDAEAFSVCGCTQEQYACDCEPNDDGTECRSCGARLVRIDVDTGEPVTSVH